MRHHSLAILCVCLMLAACGADTTTTQQQQAGDESLPQPDAASGSVTGMPNPGTPSVLPPPADDLANESEDPLLTSEDGSAVDPNAPTQPPEAGTPFEGAVPPPETMPTMPAPTPDPLESRIAPPPES